MLEFFETGKLELYNLKDDIGEKKDLSKKMPEKAKELHGKMLACARGDQSGDAENEEIRPGANPVKLKEVTDESYPRELLIACTYCDDSIRPFASCSGVNGTNVCESVRS